VRGLPNVLLFALVCFFLARCVVVVKDSFHDCVIQCDFIGPQYYFSYDHGFIRRGLPGAVINLFGGPTKAFVDAFGWGVTLAAVASVAVLAVMMFLQLRGSPLRVAAPALVLLCPISAPIFVFDPGRYDTFGVVGLAALALLAGSRWIARSPLLLAGAATAVMAAAALSEEFLAWFLALPGALLMLRHARQLGRRNAVLISAIPVAVAFACALGSSISRPTQAQVDAAQIASGRSPDTWSAALFMRATISSDVRFVAEHGLEPVLHSMLVWASVFTLAILVLGVAYGVQGRWYWYTAAGNVLATVALSVIALDQRRWWTMAFLSQVTALVIRGDSRRGERRPALRPASLRRVLAVALAVFSFVLLPNMLINPASRGHFLAVAIVGPVLAAVAAVGYVGRGRGNFPESPWTLDPAGTVPSATRTLLLATPLVLFLATLFVTASWILVPVDFWREHSTWSSISTYWFSWV
jgi:hypothetical protein